MAKLNLQLPTAPIFSTKIYVRISDINYGNHVGNDSFVSIIHEARVQWLKKHNYTELNIDGIGLIMANLCIEFKGEVFYGDEILVTIFVGEITRVSFELFYKLKTTRKEITTLIGLAKTDMVCYNYENKKVVSVPDVLKNILK